MNARRMVSIFLLLLFIRPEPSPASILPRYGSRLSMRLGGPVETLDPARARSLSERDLVSLLFETLVRRGPGGRLEPAAAERWDISSGGRVLLFHLRSGLRFSDGTAVTAQTFVDSWERLPSVAPEWIWIFSGARFEASGNLDIRVSLETPDSDFPGIFALPATAAVRVVGQVNAPSLLGSGPFRFAGIKDGVFVLIPRLDHYEGRPFPSMVQFQKVNPIAGNGKSGAFDLADAPPLSSAVGTARNRPGASWWLLVLNARRPALADADRRRALSRALDRKSLAPPGAEPQFQLPDDMEDAPGEVPPASSGMTASISLLTDAGDAVSAAAAARLPEDLGRSGFKVSIRPLPSATFDAALRSGDFDAALLRWEPPDIEAASRELVMRSEIAAAFGPDSPPSPDPAARVRQARNLDIVIPLFRLTGRVIVRDGVAGFEGGTFSSRRIANAFTLPWSGP